MVDIPLILISVLVGRHNIHPTVKRLLVIELALLFSVLFSSYIGAESGLA